MSEKPRLAVRVDGVPLQEEEARTVWKAFSAHMDANRGDVVGFAKSKGWHAVVPEYRAGQAVLRVTTQPKEAKAQPKAKKR